MSQLTNFNAARAFVEFGLAQQREGRRESASGAGSALAAAAQTLALLDEITAQLPIRRIADLGCGDWNWMRHAKWYRTKAPIEYIGWEANPDLVAQLDRRFGQRNISFHVKDIVTEALPPVDLVICRDVLFHLPKTMALHVIDKISQLGSLLLATTYPHEPTNGDIVPYLPIDQWGYYPINLHVPPFSLKPMLRRQLMEPLCSHMGSVRAVCVYDFGDLATRKCT